MYGNSAFCVSFYSESRKLLEPVSTSSSDESRRTFRSYYMGASFDSNVVIIVSAMLCALICVVVLFSMVRCALRNRGRMVSRESTEANTGMSKSAVKALPVICHCKDSRLPEAKTDCPICLAEFAEGERLRMLPECHHCFHVRCIDTWLLSHSSCPSCRQSLLDDVKAKKKFGKTLPRSSQFRYNQTPESAGGVQHAETQSALVVSENQLQKCSESTFREAANVTSSEVQISAAS